MVDDSVYTDLAWGGLDFHNNDQIEEESKLRIQQRLNAEQFNASAYPIRPAGPEMSDLTGYMTKVPYRTLLHE